MAGAPQDAPNAETRVLKAKARLVELALESKAAPGLVERAADTVRQHPWQAVALAMVTGVALGAASKRTTAGAPPVVTPWMGLVADLALRALRGVPRFGTRSTVAAGAQASSPGDPTGSEG